MYPGSQFNWYNQSEFTNLGEPEALDTSPIFMVVSSFDKGPEDLMLIKGTKFNDLFGVMDFEKHGQNALQCQRIIDAGGRLLLKRVTATDATLANVVFSCSVTAGEEQKTDAAGKPLYLDANGNETTEATGNTAIMIKTAKLKWTASNISGCKSFEDVVKKAEALTGGTPLIVFTDNGKGASSKAVRIIPDYATSKSVGKTFYTVATYEGTSSLEQQSATFDPTVVYANTAYGLDKTTCVQVNATVLEDKYEDFISEIATALDLTEDEVRVHDLIFGYNYKGALLEGLSLDAESIDLNAVYGISLKGGDNGNFGTKPVNTEPWIEEIRKVYAGEVTDEVWDVDQYKIAAICDANLPLVIKEQIAQFVNFRKDCVFFRDLGVNLNTFTEIYDAFLEQKTRSYFISDYATSYQVRDPRTRKRITVTCMYDMVECLVNHFVSGPHAPLAGVVNGFILKNAIKGTLNFTPIVTPNSNQKQAMEDIRVNYAIFEDNDCVMQSCYTTDPTYSQLSYVNNTLAIQETVRAVRTACPKNRFTFSNTLDMASYSKAVNNVLVAFAANFEELKFEYTGNRLKAAQKIFYASIKYKFGTWPQSEVFDLFALSNDY